MASFIVGSSSNGLHIRSYSRFQMLSWNPISKLGFSERKDQSCFWSDGLVQCNNKNTRNVIVYASSVPGVPLPSGPPSGPPSNSIRNWILGMVVSIVLPFFTHKLGPLGLLKNRIENAVEQVEQIVEVVEKVAEKVDKIADDIMDDLPEGQLKNIVNYVEDIAEKTAKNADSIGDLIDKVQEVEDQVESFVESLDDEARKSPTEAN
ncbi:uncharacterized protein LOC111380830 [Olea europaea var. sylvestris]|uniref:Uncharacterized protein n=1 Tax=Olea europaea subsp. europaea TaxID=158383 RepID=A0A8S0SCW9_OLEEU|nr:uncharacterized protein LOC111380830 [Olea europaea var. sylvestris]CAA2989550.1 Hypothetical predicted protein [Olea europaea subsp. europaea]